MNIKTLPTIKLQQHFSLHEKRILGECLLISSLPGKASRTLVDIARLAEGLKCILEAEPGKLDIKRCEPGILFISLQVDSLFKLVIMTSLSSFVSIQCH